MVHLEFIFVNDIKSVSRFSYFYGHPIFLALLAEKKKKLYFCHEIAFATLQRLVPCICVCCMVLYVNSFVGYCSFIITPETGNCENSKFVLLEYHGDTSIPFAF